MSHILVHIVYIMIYNTIDILIKQSVFINSCQAAWRSLVARLTLDRWIPISREYEPHQRPPLFP